jgi:hypothetical protein
MPKTVSEKCRQCAKLDLEMAIARHGIDGTNCWEGDKCHKRRTYYRNRDRYNQTKRQQYAIKAGKVVSVVSVVVPDVAAAILNLYRERKDAPLHAMGAELWVGGEKKAIAQAVHCFGWTGSQVRQYSREILKAFTGQLYGIDLERFETTVEHHPQQCPIRPCSLHE